MDNFDKLLFHIQIQMQTRWSWQEWSFYWFNLIYAEMPRQGNKLFPSSRKVKLDLIELFSINQWAIWNFGLKTNDFLSNFDELKLLETKLANWKVVQVRSGTDGLTRLETLVLIDKKKTLSGLSLTNALASSSELEDINLWLSRERCCSRFDRWCKSSYSIHQTTFLIFARVKMTRQW